MYSKSQLYTEIMFSKSVHYRNQQLGVDEYQSAKMTSIVFEHYERVLRKDTTTKSVLSSIQV